jgi:hypothetical protein
MEDMNSCDFGPGLTRTAFADVPADDAWIFDLKQEAKPWVSFRTRDGSEVHISALEDSNLIARRKRGAAKLKLKCLECFIDMRKSQRELASTRYVEF